MQNMKYLDHTLEQSRGGFYVLPIGSRPYVIREDIAMR